MIDDNAKVAAAIALFLTALISFIGMLTASSPGSKADFLALFIGVFSIGAFGMSAMMILEGSVPYGGRGSSTPEYIERAEEPVKFWAISITVAAAGAGLAIAAAAAYFDGSGLFH
jgi:hypothetical protein